MTTSAFVLCAIRLVKLSPGQTSNSFPSFEYVFFEMIFVYQQKYGSLVSSCQVWNCKFKQIKMSISMLLKVLRLGSTVVHCHVMKEVVFVLGIVHKWRHGSRGRGYQGFCDNFTEASEIKSVTIGGWGVKNVPKLRDVIYGQPLSRK